MVTFEGLPRLGVGDGHRGLAKVGVVRRLELGREGPGGPLPGPE